MQVYFEKSNIPFGTIKEKFQRSKKEGKTWDWWILCFCFLVNVSSFYIITLLPLYSFLSKKLINWFERRLEFNKPVTTELRNISHSIQKQPPEVFCKKRYS